MILTKLTRFEINVNILLFHFKIVEKKILNMKRKIMKK